MKERRLFTVFATGDQFILRISTKRLKEGGIIDLKPEEVYQLVESKKFGPLAYPVLEKIAD